MKIDKTILLEAIERIDGGCGPCGLSFLRKIQSGMTDNEFNTLIKELIRRNNAYWAEELPEEFPSYFIETKKS